MSFIQKATVLAITMALSTTISAESVIGSKYNPVEIANQNIGNNYVTELDRYGHVSRVIVTGENGSGTDAKSVVNKKVTTEVPVEIPVSYQGQEAIDFLGGSIVKVAADLMIAPETLKAEILKDPTIHVDATGHLFYIDTGVTAEQITVASTNGSVDPITTKMAPDVDVFKLHSKKDSKRTIYLDMDGEVVEGSQWSSTSLVADAYVNPAQINDYQKQQVHGIWTSVAEDYIGMDVDVTTEKPTRDQLFRDADSYNADGSLLKDEVYGIHAVITNSDVIRYKVCAQVGGQCGGVAYIGSMNYKGNSAGNVTWVFANALLGNTHNIAEATAHEVGHTVGLLHDGVAASSTSVKTGYYAGHDDWAPIMGVGYYKNITQFSKGEYANANNKQDDFLVMAAYGLVPREDDVGDTKETATTLHTGEMQVTGLKDISNYGVIGTSTDVDMYVMNVMTGPLKLEVNGWSNLNAKVTLLDADGNTVGTVVEKDWWHTNYSLLQKTIDVDVTEGVYYLKIESGNSVRADGTESYSTYGSVGQYSIKGSYAGVERPIPHAVLECTVLSGYVPFQTHCSAAKSTGGQLTYSWGTSSEADIGFWSIGQIPVELTVTNEYGLTDTISVKINAMPVLNPKSVMHVKTVKVSVDASGKKNMYGKTIITVVDNRGKPVSGAIVSGVFNGVFTNSVIAKTNAAGQAIFKTAIVPNFSGTVAFKVLNMSKVGVSYNPLLNVTAEGTFCK